MDETELVSSMMVCLNLFILAGPMPRARASVPLIVHGVVVVEVISLTCIAFTVEFDLSILNDNETSYIMMYS